MKKWGILVLLMISLSWGTTANAQSRLRVGAARVDITPAPEAGSVTSGKYAHERLYVRAIVLDNGTTSAALIGADQGGLFEGVWQRRNRLPTN